MIQAISKNRLNQRQTETVAFWALLLSIIILRTIVLLKFGFEYTDNDQAIMWLGTRNYSDGLFHEPMFYGQAYNPMLESLLAVPLYWCGVPLNIALPLVTVALSLAPFFLVAGVAFRKGNRIAALFILCLLLLLPVEYDLINCMSRGFVSGVFIAAGVFWYVFYKTGKAAFFFTGFLMALSFFVNPNSIIFTLPLVFYAFLVHYKSWKFYVFVLLGLIPPVLLFGWANSFYNTHPNYVLHALKLEFSQQYFREGIGHINRFWEYFTPMFLWKQSWVVLLLPFIATVYFFKAGKKQLAAMCLLIPPVLVAPFFSSKILDGMESLFYSWSRMYLAVPLLFAVILSQIPFRGRYIAVCCLVLGLSGGVVKMYLLDDGIEQALSKPSMVMLGRTEVITANCIQLKRVSAKYNVDLVYILAHSYFDFLNYACPACDKEFPKTIKPEYERRTWRLLEDAHTVYPRILLIDDRKTDMFDTVPNVQLLDTVNGYYLISNNKLTVAELIFKFKLPFRMY